jgi:hypothetical protein
MRRAQVAALAAVMLLPAGMTAHDEMPYIVWLEGSLGVNLAVIDVMEGIEDAEVLAEDLREWLLAVTPAECYHDDYVAMWVLYGTLQHMSDPVLGAAAAESLAGDFDALGPGFGTGACASELAE